MAADEVSPRAYAPILSSGTVFLKKQAKNKCAVNAQEMFLNIEKNSL